MNKKEYLEKLEYYLKERHYDRAEIVEILDDYAFTIDEAIDNGVKEEELEKFLGNPREIVNNLRRTIVIKRVKDNKFVALSPFISVILFFTLGFGFGYWDYAWMVFLLIPVSAILSSRKASGMNTIVDIMPFFALGVFLAIGLIMDIWHPTWVVFLLIPAVSILDSSEKYKALSFIVFILGPTLYLLSFYFYPFDHNWVLLLLMVIPSIYSGLISFRINGVRNRKLEIIFGSIIAVLVTVFVLFGSIYGIWHPLWLIFLLIPMAAIALSMNLFDKELPLVAFSPFIAIILFFLAGELFNGYEWSWLFFLLIPVSALITRTNKKEKIAWVTIAPFVAVTLFFLAGQYLNGYQWSWLFFLLIPMTAIITD